MVGGSQAGRPLQAHFLGTATSLALAAAKGRSSGGCRRGPARGFLERGVLVRREGGHVVAPVAQLPSGGPSFAAASLAPRFLGQDLSLAAELRQGDQKCNFPGEGQQIRLLLCWPEAVKPLGKCIPGAKLTSQ